MSVCDQRTNQPTNRFTGVGARDNVVSKKCYRRMTYRCTDRPSQRHVQSIMDNFELNSFELNHSELSHFELNNFELKDFELDDFELNDDQSVGRSQPASYTGQLPRFAFQHFQDLHISILPISSNNLGFQDFRNYLDCPFPTFIQINISNIHTHINISMIYILSIIYFLCFVFHIYFGGF